MSQVYEDRNNPRIISDAKFQKLIDSILVFPKMMSLRPVVIDAEHNSLGGNMRLRSLNSISQMTYDAIKKRLEGISDYKRKTADEQAGQSPYKMFEGVMRPEGEDENGDLIYYYDPTKTI